jgi:hypothetical protein
VNAPDDQHVTRHLIRRTLGTDVLTDAYAGYDTEAARERIGLALAVGNVLCDAPPLHEIASPPGAEPPHCPL